jgi:hypothetical protein
MIRIRYNKQYNSKYLKSYTISYTIFYSRLVHLTLPVLQGVGKLGLLYSIPPSMSAYMVQDDHEDPGEEYITYAYRTSHQVLRWLPAKLAEWIGAIFCEELNIPDKQGPLWTAAELNAITTGNLVGGPHGHLRTFGCIQWENELFNGRPKARCYPFNIQGHRFRLKNPQVESGRCFKSYPISLPLSCCTCIISYSISYTIPFTISQRRQYYNDFFET